MTKANDILIEARRRFEESHSAETENRTEALKDIKFVNNVEEGQWPEEVKTQRKQDKRPCLTINKLRKFIKLLVGEQRGQKPGIKVRPADSQADVATATVIQDVIRSIEYDSQAEIAYDTAYEHALTGGLGFFRILVEYADDKSFDQVIRIKRIFNPFSVYLDQSAEEFDYSDGKYAFVTKVIEKAEFERMYPGKSLSGFEGDMGEEYALWFVGDTTRIAEYFWKEPTKKYVIRFDDGEVQGDLTKADVDALTKIDPEAEIEIREVDTFVLKWAKINGAEILEGPIELPGKYIPIIPVLGDEVSLKGKRILRSIARDAKDPQRMYNYWRTTATELVALAPKAPVLITPEQIEGHKIMWDNAHRKNTPYLIYNAIPGMEAPKQWKQTTIPDGVVMEANVSDADIKDTFGIYNPSLGNKSNERSGKALMLRQQQSRTGTMLYFDNFLRAQAYAGRVILDLIPYVYTQYRLMRVTGEDGKEKVVEVNIQKVGKKGEKIVLNDLSVGLYDAIVEGGSAFASKRVEQTETMVQILQYVPDFAPIMAPLIIEKMDFPGSQQLAAELKQVAAQQAQAKDKPKK